MDLRVVSERSSTCARAFNPVPIRGTGRPKPLHAYQMSAVDHNAVPDAMDVARPGRRAVLITVPALLAAPAVWGVWTRAKASDMYRVFTGYNMQPDLYLGYGTSMNHSPQYTFEYPAEWEEEAVTKTEKSTMGMDGRVLDPKHPKEKAFVIALGGKDYQDARMVNLKQTMDAFAGGDADLRAAITDATDIKQEVKKLEGRDVYMYDITSDKRRYLSTISRKDGTMYALFVTATPAGFARKEDQLRHIQETFTLL